MVRMKRKILSLCLVGILSLGLIGCGGPKKTDKEYPFFNEMQIIKVNKEEKLSLKITEEEAREKINGLLSEFENAANEGTTMKFERLGNSIDGLEEKDPYAVYWQDYWEIMGFRLENSQGALLFRIIEDEDSDRKKLDYSIALVSMLQTKECDNEKYGAINAEIDWLNTQGFNLNLEEIKEKINNMLTKANNGEEVESEIIKLDEDGTELEIVLVNLGEQVYNVGLTINGYEVYFDTP